MDTNNNFGSRRSPVGPIIGLIVIIALIVLGGLYFWGQRVGTGQNQSPQNNQTENTPAAPVAPSDDLNSLQTDLNASATSSSASQVDSLKAQIQ